MRAALPVAGAAERKCNDARGYLDPVRLLARRLLEVGYDDLPARERHVLERVAKRLAVSRDVNADYETSRTFGEKLSDDIASFGGSWTFISMIFGGAVASWVIVNTLLLVWTWGKEPFDPIPSSS